MPDIAIMAAMSINRAIGYQGQLPWHLPADLDRVYDIAQGKSFIMGKQTYLSSDVILSPSKNIILSTSDLTLTETHSYRANSLKHAFSLLKPNEPTLIMGGSQVYLECFQYAQRMYLTLVHEHFNGDAFFPTWNENEWKLIKQQDFKADSQNKYAYSFMDYIKK